MAGLTKTQINYLENKLDRAVTEKVDKFKSELGNKTLDVLIVEELAKGNIELLPKEEIIAFLKQIVKSKSYYYSISVAIQDLINEDDKNRLDSEVKGRDTKLQDYRDRLSKAKQNALDSIVLNGVDVEVALAELDKV